MNVEEFIELAQKYSDMGWAVQEQFRDVLDTGPSDDQNPNALEMIRDFLRDNATNLEDAQDWIDELTHYLEGGDDDDFFGGVGALGSASRRIERRASLAKYAALTETDKQAIVEEAGTAANLSKLSEEDVDDDLAMLLEML